MTLREMTDTHPDPDGELVRAVEFIRPMLQGSIAVPEHRPETAIASLALLRTMIQQCELLIKASEARLAEAASPNLRAMFEAWVQVIYLVKGIAEDTGPIEYRAFALLEFKAYLAYASEDPTDIESIDQEIEDLRSNHPAEVKRVEQLRSSERKGNRNYWTGLGPTALVERANKVLGPEHQLSRLYKFTSWDVHHILTAVLHIAREESAAGPTIQLGYRQPPEEAAAFNATIAVGMLRQTWTMLRDEWGTDFPMP
jgi:hypothetical protein